jgi:hypothetical protein
LTVRQHDSTFCSHAQLAMPMLTRQRVAGFYHEQT